MRLKLGLTAEQKLERRNGIGGSDASIIMGGDPAALIALWEQKRGLAEPEDLSRVLPVQMGSHTEPLNLDWYELTTGRLVTHEGEPRKATAHPFMRCTLDGLTTTKDGKPAVFQAKHVNAYSKIEEVAQKYMAQVHHEMHVVGVRHAVLSVFIGTMVYEAVEIECDDFYLAQLIDREREFWRCVETGEPPAAMPVVPAPVLPTTFRTVDMGQSNSWIVWADRWRSYKDTAKQFELATKELKGLVEPNVCRAHGAGIEVTRAKNGALTIKELKAVKEAA